MAKIGKFAQITARVLQRIIWPTKIYGAENFEKFNGGIIISNHYASAADGSIIFNAFFKNYFNALVKEEAFKTKIGNWFFGFNVWKIRRHKRGARVFSIKLCYQWGRCEMRKVVVFTVKI